ncbi:MAG TPA: hypothetical protein PLH91_13295, partial [Tenuifilaceae bacterium]|nr:hypothetical protein [Tenuifilaceae bacterium]
DAIKIPIFISRTVKIINLKGEVILDSENIKTGMILIGFGNIPIFDYSKSRSIWNNLGIVTFKGKASIGHGSKIGCRGKLKIGKNFQVTAESSILCNYAINFNDDVLLSWQIQIMDTDFHKVYSNNILKNQDSAIFIGSHTWIGSRVIINKGVVLPDNTVVASGSVVTKSFYESNILIGGVPANILQKNITWEK